MPGSGGMDTLKAEALKQGRWRLGEDGYVEKGPFPKDKTTVNVSVVGAQPETGATHPEPHATPCRRKPRGGLRDQARGARERPDQSTTSTASPRREGTLYFQARDTTGHYETGAPVRWTAELKIRHQVEPAADKRRVTLACTPKANLSYTLDGSNPRDGTPYEGPFEIGSAATRLLVYARAGEANKTADFQIPASGDKTRADRRYQAGEAAAQAYRPGHHRPRVRRHQPLPRPSRARGSRVCASRSARARTP